MSVGSPFSTDPQLSYPAALKALNNGSPVAITHRITDTIYVIVASGGRSTGFQICLIREPVVGFPQAPRMPLRDDSEHIVSIAYYITASATALRMAEIAQDPERYIMSQLI